MSNKSRNDPNVATGNYTRSGLEQKTTTYICKWCQVPVYSKVDTHAKYGHEHAPDCPRRVLFQIGALEPDDVSSP